jgi:hypothetical protein
MRAARCRSGRKADRFWANISTLQPWREPAVYGGWWPVISRASLKLSDFTRWSAVWRKLICVCPMSGSAMMPGSSSVLLPGRLFAQFLRRRLCRQIRVPSTRGAATVMGEVPVSLGDRIGWGFPF